MAIRRTREDKLQAKMRREEGKYAWKPAAEKPAKTPEKQTQKTVQVSGATFFWGDIRRTIIATSIVVILLLGAGYLFR